MSRLYNILNKLTDRSSVKTISVAGTTNAQGALSLGGAVAASAVVLAVTCTNNANAMCIPWKYNNATWYAKIVSWASLASFGDTGVTLNVLYLDQ